MQLLAITIVVLYVLCIMVPRKMTYAEVYATTLFVLYFQGEVDIYFNLKLDMYGYFGHGPDWISMALIWGTYPALSYLILTSLHDRTLLKKILITVVWTIALTLVEVAFLKSGILYYVTWKLWYSTILYPVFIAIIWWNLKLFRMLKNHS